MLTNDDQPHFTFKYYLYIYIYLYTKDYIKDLPHTKHFVYTCCLESYKITKDLNKKI
jgi:hypothetical protein